ncbi:hypothetical protein GCM10027048_27060 [Hymenobacter coalescens]
MPAYPRYFDHFFATQRISRFRFRALGNYALTQLREANLSAAFAPHAAELQAALNGFEPDLLRGIAHAPAGGTTAFRVARKQWLAFVDDAMKDYVTPRLRKLPVYAEFRQYRKSRLRALDHTTLLLHSRTLLNLYESHQAALHAEDLCADAQRLFRRLAHADESRTIAEAISDQARMARSADWLALARALRRFKAQLELHFDDPAEVYRFFDLTAAQPAPARLLVAVG